MRFKKDERIIWHPAESGMELEIPRPTSVDGYEVFNEFIDSMKRLIPYGERSWNKKMMRYWISDLYLDEVDNLLFEYFERTGEGRDV